MENIGLDIITIIFGLLGTIITWAGVITLISLILGFFMPIAYNDMSEEIDVNIGIKAFTILHVTKSERGKVLMTFFHKHGE